MQGTIPKAHEQSAGDPGAECRISVFLYQAGGMEDCLFQCPGAGGTENVAQSVPVQSVADELLKFKFLLDAGAITEDEYNA